MVEVACGAERNFAFDLVGAEAVGTMDFARAETEVDFVFGGADGVDVVFFVLLEAKLCVSSRLEFVECDANYTHRCWQFSVKLASEARDVAIAIKGLFGDELSVVVAASEIKGPDIDAARIELFAAEAVADIFGKMNEACFGFFARKVAAVEYELAANGLDVASGAIDFDAA